MSAATDETLYSRHPARPRIEILGPEVLRAIETALSLRSGAIKATLETST